MSARFSKDPVVDRSLRHSIRDGVAFSVQVGAGETYFSAFALFLRATAPQVALLTTLPPLLGSLAQLFSAWVGRYIGRRRLVLIGCVLQAAIWIPILLVPMLFGAQAIIALLVLLILYHSNFHLGSFNSQVAFFSMLLVAGSGIVGRHFYAGIHRGLYGRKTSLQEVQQELSEAISNNHGLARFMPGLVARLERNAAALQDHAIRRTIGIRRSLRWTFTHHLERLSLLWLAHRELKAAAAASPNIAKNSRELRRAAARYIREFTVLTGRVAQFSLYERLFALWHILHLPIFFLMVLTAFVHIFAVHVY